MDFFYISDFLNWAESHGLYCFGTKIETIEYPNKNRIESGNFIIEFDTENPNPVTWKVLVTASLPNNCKVSINGTREISGEGWRDGSLLPEYKELLPEVNEIRKSKGLKEIYR